MLGASSSGDMSHAFHLNFLYMHLPLECMFINWQDVHRYASFSEMLGAESLTKVLPGVETIEEGNSSHFHYRRCLSFLTPSFSPLL